MLNSKGAQEVCNTVLKRHKQTPCWMLQGSYQGKVGEFAQPPGAMRTGLPSLKPSTWNPALGQPCLSDHACGSLLGTAVRHAPLSCTKCGGAPNNDTVAAGRPAGRHLLSAGLIRRGRPGPCWWRMASGNAPGPGPQPCCRPAGPPLPARGLRAGRRRHRHLRRPAGPPDPARLMHRPAAARNCRNHALSDGCSHASGHSRGKSITGTSNRLWADAVPFRMHQRCAGNCTTT